LTSGRHPFLGWEAFPIHFLLVKTRIGNARGAHFYFPATIF
jgi:hypothetical protein